MPADPEYNFLSLSLLRRLILKTLRQCGRSGSVEDNNVFEQSRTNLLRNV